MTTTEYYAYAGNDPVNASDPGGHETLSWGVGVEATTPLSGGRVSMGFVRGTNEQGEFKSGAYFSFGATTGFALGAGVGFDYDPEESIDDVNGDTISAGGGLLIFGRTAKFDPKTGKYKSSSNSVGYSRGKAPLGVSLGYDTTLAAVENPEVKRPKGQYIGCAYGVCGFAKEYHGPQRLSKTDRLATNSKRRKLVRTSDDPQSPKTDKQNTSVSGGKQDKLRGTEDD